MEYTTIYIERYEQYLTFLGEIGRQFETFEMANAAKSTRGTHLYLTKEDTGLPSMLV